MGISCRVAEMQRNPSLALSLALPLLRISVRKPALRSGAHLHRKRTEKTMADKADRMKARLPRGFVDRHAADIRAVDAMTAKIRAVYELYGFDPVEQPMVEYTDALGKFLPDQDRPNEGVIPFQAEAQQRLSMR